MFRLLIPAIIAVVALGGATIALAEDDDYTPILGKGEHTVWDAAAADFGATFEWQFTPAEDRWWGGVAARGENSSISFTCFFDENSGRVSIAYRFGLQHGMKFTASDVQATIKIDKRTFSTTLTRLDHYPAFAERAVSNWGVIRSAETFTVVMGPFEFEHNIAGLFDVPAAQNLTWCADRN